MANSIKILSTKKLAQSQISIFDNELFEVFDVDFIATKNNNFDIDVVENENLIFTSQNAVLSILNHQNIETLKKLNVFCVGMKTKKLLTNNGFNVVAYTGYAADLGEIISLVYADEKFVFLCGNLRRDDLPNVLKENNVDFKEVEVYQTEIKPLKIKEKFDGILFFSPSGVSSFMTENSIKKELCFCIGEPTASALAKYKIENIILANQPTVESVLETVLNEYK